ncbi:hypothetical protein [Enterobacter asburiae]|uniref:hypothetical protein n=1 Tax=Enterobacter asburiae TaxID=61645 RepID=UPI00210CA0F5|nr:hypothetical protein [Enterobacter asburiae]MCQ4368941.1 hypothetical protein [Enterobacter asburiae]HDC4621155.1 hypothetical protein [Enterobacter asburiae]
MQDFYAEEDEKQRVLTSKVCDNVLLNIVNMVNYEEVNLGMTLFCKGIVIGGDVISGKEYFSTMADLTKDKSQQISELYQEVGATFYNEMDEAKDQIPLNYIHMKNVVLHDGGQLTPFNGGLIRLCIDEIDGHIIGRPTK